MSIFNLLSVFSVNFEKPWGNYLLEKIVETQQPSNISLVPQTLGWKIIFSLLLIYFSYKAFLMYQRYKRNAYRREALAWIKHYQADDEWFYRQLPALLRKTAIAAFDRKQVALLTGDVWEKWLDQQCQKTLFSSSGASLLYQVAFAADFQLSLQQKQLLVKQVSTWIKHHRGSND